MPIRHIVRTAFCLLMVASSAIYLFWQGQMMLVVLGVLWGIIYTNAMEYGIRTAPEENWNRSSTSAAGSFVLVFVVLLMAAPCFPIALSLGLLPAFAVSWMILLGASITVTVYRRLYGPMKRPDASLEVPDQLN